MGCGQSAVFTEFSAILTEFPVLIIDGCCWIDFFGWRSPRNSWNLIIVQRLLLFLKVVYISAPFLKFSYYSF
jgi:hypothetical protein